MNQSGMSRDSAQRLPEILRVARYYESVAELAMEAAAAARETPMPVLIESGGTFIGQAVQLFSSVDPESGQEEAYDWENSLRNLEGDYQILKAELLEAGALGRQSVADMDARLRAASAIRRAVQQAAKATRLLGDGGPVKDAGKKPQAEPGPKPDALG
jgi:phosphate:Na+ symporter